MNSLNINHEFRKNLRIKLGECMNEPTFSKWGHNLEIGIYNSVLQDATQKKIVKKWENPYFVQLYIDKCRSIYMNIQKPSILAKLKSGEIKPHEIAFMTHQQLDPEKWNALIDAKIKRDISKYETHTESMTDMFKCSKCKSNRTTYRTAQIRSADEPETIFVTCLDCGKKWKSS